MSKTLVDIEHKTEDQLNTKEDYVIEIEHLQKGFNSNIVLRDINIKIKKGENVVILGKSGIGKSVLIKCIVGLIYPDKGTVKVFGDNVPDLSDTELNTIRTRVGFLFQGNALYDSMTVRENLEFPLQRNQLLKDKLEIDDLIEEALENVGLLEAIDKYPSELSGGMKKRIGLARTLILKPDIILYDEPTTGLDPLTSREISNLILKIQNQYKASSIIITHDLACARITSNRMIIIKDGKIHVEGTFDELKKSSDPWVQSFFT